MSSASAIATTLHRTLSFDDAGAPSSNDDVHDASMVAAGAEHYGGRVLSIQSHTVHGYVGNKSAVFPLQLLGFDVDPINSVQFSNHTGYDGGFKGQVLDGAELWDLVKGLDANQLLPGYSHLLTGYIGSPSFLRTVLRILARLRDFTAVTSPRRRSPSKGARKI